MELASTSYLVWVSVLRLALSPRQSRYPRAEAVGSKGLRRTRPSRRFLDTNGGGASPKPLWRVLMGRQVGAPTQLLREYTRRARRLPAASMRTVQVGVR